jgi:hypothetical protein
MSGSPAKQRLAGEMGLRGSSDDDGVTVARAVFEEGGTDPAFRNWANVLGQQAVALRCAMLAIEMSVRQ